MLFTMFPALNSEKKIKNPTLSMTSMLKRLLCLFGAFDKEEGARKENGGCCWTPGAIAAPEQLVNSSQV